MKELEKKQAMILRSQGKSIKEISRELCVAKSSVSVWVRNVELSELQKDYLRQKGLFKDKIERTRKTRLANEKYKRDLIIDAARNSVPVITNEHIWLIGMMLYWGEGGKTRRAVRIANSDPDVIKMMMIFFRKICEIPEEKFRGYIHIHPHLNHKFAESYWSQISGIPKSRFFNTYRIPNKSSKNKKDSLPYGTFDIYVYDTQLFYKITGWASGISNQLISNPQSSFSSGEKI